MASIRHFLSGVRAELATPLLLVTLRLGGAAAAFATSLIMARTMDLADMGVALTCMSAAPLAAILVTGSSEAGCIRFMVAYLERGDVEKARGMIRFNRLVTLSIGSLSLLALFGWYLSTVQVAQSTTAIFSITAVAAVLLGWLRMSAAHAMALGAVVRSVAPFSFIRQVLLLLGLAIWAISGQPLSIEVAVSCLLVSVGAAVLLQALLNRSPMQQVGTGRADLSDQKEWAAVGLQLGLTLLFVQFSRDLTLVVGAVSLTPEDISVLGIATAIVGFAKFFCVAVNQSITPKLSRAIAVGNTEAFMYRVAITNHLKFWPMVLAFLAFALLGGQIAMVFGPAFANMTPILLILMLEPLALAFFGPGGSFLSLSGHQRVLLRLSIVTVLLLVLAVTLGARAGGLPGAALGSSVTWIFWSVSLATLTRRYMKIDISLLSSFRYLRARQHNE